MDALLPKIPCISDCFLDTGTEANLSPSNKSWELSPEKPNLDRNSLLLVSEDCEDDITLNPQLDYSRFWNHEELAISSGKNFGLLVWLYSAVANTLAWHARDPEFEPRYSHFSTFRFSFSTQVFAYFRDRCWAHFWCLWCFCSLVYLIHFAPSSLYTRVHLVVEFRLVYSRHAFYV